MIELLALDVVLTLCNIALIYALCTGKTIREVVHERSVEVQRFVETPTPQVCPACNKESHVLHKYADGSAVCTDCR